MRAYLLTLLVFANSIGAAVALEFDEECLVLSSVKEGRREAFATDGLLHVIARDGFAAPKAGDMVPHERGKEAPWRSATYKDGELILPKSNDEDTEQGESRRRRRGGGADYVYLTATSEAEEVLLLNAKGQSAVMVNGEWRIGDAYGNNPVPIPVLVKKGINRFLFAASRRAEAWGAAIVVNASTEWLDDLEIHANYRKDEVTPCGPIPPLGFRKLGFLITNDQVVTGNVSFNVSLQHKGNNFNVDK